MKSCKKLLMFVGIWIVCALQENNVFGTLTALYADCAFKLDCRTFCALGPLVPNSFFFCMKSREMAKCSFRRVTPG